MNYYAQSSINLSCALLPVIAGRIRYKLLDHPSRIFFLLLVFSFITEVCAFIAAIVQRNNLPVYNIANLLQIFIITLYFNSCIGLFKKNNAGIYIGLLSVVLGVLDMIFIEKITRYNSNFFLYQTVLIFIMSAFYFRQLILPPYLNRYANPHLWFIIVLVSFYVLTFFMFSLYDYISIRSDNHTEVADYVILIVNALSNIGFACVFFLYAKISRSNVR